MRSEGYSTWSVCVSVTTFSDTMRNKLAQKKTHWFHLEVIFIKTLHSKVMPWKPSEQANMLINTGLPRPVPLALCILMAQEVTTKGVYQHTRMLSTAVATPCQTLIELLAGDHE